MERSFIGKVMLWYIIFKEPGLIAATTADKLDIDGVEKAHLQCKPENQYTRAPICLK